MQSFRYSRGFAALSAALVTLLGPACGSNPNSAAPPAVASDSSTLSVVAGFYPIQYFAQRIGGDKLDVYNPVPPGAEPHDLELTPRAVERIQKARVFLYLGNGFQPAVDRALDTIKGADVLVKDVSDGSQRVASTGKETDEQGSSSSQPGVAADPHVWLDPAR